MDSNQLKRYAELKAQEKAVQEELKSLSPIIIEMIKSEGHEKVKTNLGTFSVTTRKTYQYTENTQSEIKRMQEHEKATGLAKVVESSSLTFYSPKPE